MNYAVLKSGGKQYKVSAGDVILVEKILGESGSKITFEDIVMMGEGAQIHIEEAELIIKSFENLNIQLKI